MAPSIIDTPWNTAAKAGALAAAGVTTVMRYYNFANSRALPEKCLTLVEAEALSAAGIAIGVVFQQRQNVIDDFDRAKGRRAGRRAFALAHDEIGQPDGAAIYFGVDFDASEAEVDDRIAPYFEGVAEAMREEAAGEPPYRIGVYGSGLVGRLLGERGLADLVWLGMARGFRETRQALDEGRYDLEQVPPATTLLGLGVDHNNAHPDGRDFGAFTVPVDAAPAEPRPGPGPVPGEAATRLRVTARSGLRLRAGPGTGFDVVGAMALGEIVHDAGRHGDWVRVDRQGDGAVDGFAFTDFLEPAIG
ncbi:MAG: DUF1906 domain-containing protein [Azospirillaceae bacterium]